MKDEHVAHVLDDQGVTDAPFHRHGNTWTNTEEITLRPGAVLDLGNGMALANPQGIPSVLDVLGETRPPSDPDEQHPQD